VSSLRVGGRADWFRLAQDDTELAAGLRWAHEHELPVRIVGGGSNLLIADAGVAGLVIKPAATVAQVVERDSGAVVVAAAGANLANLARRLAKQGWGGLEWAANVPGTVGGAVVNNAGAFGGDTAHQLVRAVVVDAAGARQELLPEALGYGYRTSVLKRGDLGNVAVAEVELRLERRDAGVADGLVRQYSAQRMQSQPRQLSAGSVFANPPGAYAGQLIEAAGLKGAQIGGAQISTQHANFIVNPGGASARDVYLLMRHAQEVVHARSGTWLQPEIELFGRWTDQERAALRIPGVLSRG
jgi:UDP-N-acetylmuramate dehydrogenase